MVSASTTPRFGIFITTVDSAQGLIKGVMKGDAMERTILVVEVPNAFRWPQAGESWMVCQKNGTWYLEGFIPSTPVVIQGYDPGDLILTSPTGIVHVTGTPGGVGNFTLSKPIVAPQPSISFGGLLLATKTHLSAAQNINLVTL